MNKILNVGVVGCGQIAQIAHIPFLNELPEFQVGGICDISKQVLEAVGDRFGIEKRFEDYRELVAQPEIDAVLVCNIDHADPVIAALEAGKHVMTEKPMAFNVEQADMMIHASKKNDRRLMVAYMKRYDPGFEWALTLIRKMKDLKLVRVHDFGGSYHINHEIYDLVSAQDVSRATVSAAQAKQRAAMVKAIGEERAEHVDLYNLLLGLCSHDAGVLEEAVGLPERILYADAYDKLFLVALLELKDGVRCIWESGSITDSSAWDEQLVAYGSQRMVEVRFPFPYLKNAATEVFVSEMEGEVNVHKRVVASYDEAFKREWRHFYQCVTQHREPITNGEKGRADIDFLASLVRAAFP